MKKFLVSIICLLSLFRLGAQNFQQVKLSNMNGNPVELASYMDDGIPVVISFWATTCKPCLSELDTVSELLPDWEEECDFHIIAVSTDDSRSLARAKAMAKGRGWDGIEVLFDTNSELKRAMNVTSNPHVFIYDKNGKQVYNHTGYKPGDENEIIKTLKGLK